MDVALLGGSFNPPHLGHLLAAHVVRALEPIDAVWFVPAAHHPFGKPLVAFEHRLAMCRLMCTDASGWLQASDIEQLLGGPSYTVETLRALHQRWPDNRWTLVVGSDIVPEMARWREVAEIQRLARIRVLNRAGHAVPEAIGPPLAKVSSTEVRAALAAGRGGDGLVHREVLAYIARHGLYRDPTH
jgi:nicotinate-nucleotide adenylyltransferase